MGKGVLPRKDALTRSGSPRRYFAPLRPKNTMLRFDQQQHEARSTARVQYHSPSGCCPCSSALWVQIEQVVVLDGAFG
jgi:hypothetical protein